MSFDSNGNVIHTHTQAQSKLVEKPKKETKKMDENELIT